MKKHMSFKDRFDLKYKCMPEVFGAKPMPVLEKALDYIQSGKALDLGVGNGRNTIYLLSKSFEVTGVDASKEGIKILRERVPNDSKLILKVSDVSQFETKEKFDLVLAAGLLHFLNTKDVKLLINKMKVWTKQGGLNVIAVRMVQNFRQDLPHIFEHNELKEFYQNKDWAIMEYREGIARKAKVASLIARKGVGDK